MLSKRREDKMQSLKNILVYFLSFGVFIYLFTCLVSASEEEPPKVFSEEPQIHVGINVDLKDSHTSDTIVIGSNVLLENKIKGDFNALGENVLIASPIQEDLDVIGNRVMVSSFIEGDAQIFASKVKFTSSSSVKGQTKITAQKVFLGGNFQGDVFVKSHRVYINGTTEENLNLKAHKIVVGSQAILKKGFSCPKGAMLTINPRARILESIVYFDEKENSLQASFDKTFETGLFSKIAMFFDGALTKCVSKIGDLRTSTWSLSVFIFLWIVALGCIFIFHRITPGTLWRLSEKALENPGRSLGLGLAGLIFIPFFALLMALTLVGVPFSFVIILFYSILLFLGKIVGTWVLGQWLVRFTPFRSHPSFGKDIFIFTIALIMVTFLGLIPILGWLFATLVFLMGIGSILGVLFFKDPVFYSSDSRTLLP